MDFHHHNHHHHHHNHHQHHLTEIENTNKIDGFWYQEAPDINKRKSYKTFESSIHISIYIYIYVILTYI